jgi:hypothetical protein
MTDESQSQIVELCVTDIFDYATCRTTKHPLELGIELSFHPASSELLLLEIQKRCKRCGRIYEWQLLPIDRR